MFNKLIAISLLIILIASQNSAFAKRKECAIKPTYDIVVSDDSLQLINKRQTININAKGLIKLNDNPVDTKGNIQLQAKQFHAFLYQQLPNFEKQSYQQLDDLRANFEIAIREKLDNKNDLLQNLNGLYDDMIVLLQKTIITHNGVTNFYYQPFNDLKANSEAMGKKRFYKIIGGSIIHFDVMKNFSMIKQIAKNEWKQQKVKLKQFDQQVCELFTQIDQQYKQLVSSLNQS